MKLLLEDGSALLLEEGGSILLDIPGDIPKPLYQWHCRAFGDKTTLIRSSMDPANDLIKGDGVTSSTYPNFITFGDVFRPRYIFDGANDYVSNWPTMPDVYTVVAMVDSGEGPELWTCNDDTIEAALTTSGAWSGSLYRLVIYDEILDSVQIASLAYYWVSRLPRGGCKGIDHRLILDGSCILSHRYIDGDSDDRTDNGHDGTETDVTYLDEGAGFLVSTSEITVPYAEDLQLSELSISFTASVNTQRAVVERGTNYKIWINSSSVSFRASSVTRTVSYSPGTTIHHYAITCVSGEKFKLYVDGVYVDEASDVSTLGTSASDLEIGKQVLSSNTGIIGVLQFYNRVLNQHEIKALYYRSKIG